MSERGRPDPVYLDWNATTPPHPDVLAAMAEAAEATWGNPASVHGAGRAAKAVVEAAREAVGALVGLHPRDVVFMSGGTEANNLALVRPFLDEHGAARPGTLVTSRLEHPSVISVAEALAARGIVVVWLPVPASGRLDPDDLARALAGAAPGPKLVAVQAVNHETGVIQPVEACAAVAHAAGAELHVDAVQAASRLPPSAWSGADTVALTAHKMRGPKGIGALGTQPGIVVRPLLRGGSQERGVRPGTVDPVAAAGFGVAARGALDGPRRYAALAVLRDQLEADLVAVGSARGRTPSRVGTAERAPHVSNLAWPGWSADELAAALDLEGVCVSAGSACAAGTAEPSPVVRAMLGEKGARGAIRVSLGVTTTVNDVSSAIAAYDRVLGRGSLDG